MAAEQPRSWIPAVPAATADWTGIYFGVNGSNHGYGDSEWGAGGHAGVNWQWKGTGLVLGVEIDASKAWLLEQQQGIGNDSVLAVLDWYGSARARVGWAIGSVLPYATAGWAYGVVDTSAGTSEADGFVWGAGFELLSTPKLSVRAEWLKYELGVTKVGQESFDFDQEVVRLGLSYKL